MSTFVHLDLNKSDYKFLFKARYTCGSLALFPYTVFNHHKTSILSETIVHCEKEIHNMFIFPTDLSICA